jgi:hypothetical protein
MPHCSFTSQDPLGLSAGENLYAYAPNVWQWIDPLGLLYQGSYVPYSAITKVAKPGLFTKMAGRIGSKFLGPVGVAVGVAEVSYLAGQGIGAIMYPSQMVPYEKPENLEVTNYVDTDDWIGIRNGKFYTSTGKQVTAGDFADWLTRLNRRDNSFGNKCNSALSGGPTANHNQYKAGGGDDAEPEIVPPISTDEQVVYDTEEGYVTTSGRKVTVQQYYDWRNRKFDAEFNNGPKTTTKKKIPIYKNTKPMKSDYIGEETGRIWGTKVKYLSEAERAEYKLTIKNGRVYDSNGELFDTKSASSVFKGGEGNAIFVMDVYGNIYASKSQAVGKFHHSSFLAGKPVAAAGEISVKDGVIESVSRKSGHYWPDEEHLAQFMEELEHQGVDILSIKDGGGF